MFKQFMDVSLYQVTGGTVNRMMEEPEKASDLIGTPGSYLDMMNKAIDVSNKICGRWADYV